jgi:hypothetical protein
MEQRNTAESSIARQWPGTKNLRPWPKGVSGNPLGSTSRRARHKRIVAELIEDFGGNVGPLDRILIEQAGWLLVQGQDLQRRFAHGKLVSDEEMTRCANGAARILLRLRGKKDRRDEPSETLQEYAARVTREKTGGAAE